MNPTQQIFKYALFAVLLYLVAIIISPFFTAIVFAAFFAAAFGPLNEKLSAKMNKSISSLITVLGTIIIILIPLSVFIGLVAREAIKFISAFDTEKFLGFLNQYNNFEIWGQRINTAAMETNLQQGLNTAAKTIYQIAMDAGASIMNFGVLFFVFLFLYYYFLKDGKEIVEITKKLLPFTKSQNTHLIGQCKRVAETVFKGYLFIAIISGLIAYTGFYALQVPGAIIWAILATILSLIPTIGVFLVYLAAALFTIPLAGYGTFALLMIYYLIMDLVIKENLIKPAVLDNKFKIHPILIFFAIIGGVHAFQSAGMLYGPLIVILFISVLNFITAPDKSV